MARPKIKSATDQRPFIMVYQDFLESDLLDNHYQKLVYVYLKKFADSKNQCFPSVKTLSKLTKISVNKVKLTLAELEQKGVISKENRTRPDGGKSSNLYTLYDFKELWNAGSSEDVATVADEISEANLVAELKARGYTVIKEKEPDTLQADQSNNESSNNLFRYDISKSIPNPQKSQELERYTIEQIKQIFDYDILVEREPLYHKDIDTVMDILYDTLNCNKPTIRVSGEDKPTMVVIGRLMRLNHETIMYVISKYAEQTIKINNHDAYLLTMLYKAEEQMHLDITNQVQHDMYWGTQT